MGLTNLHWKNRSPKKERRFQDNAERFCNAYSCTKRPDDVVRPAPSVKKQQLLAIGELKYCFLNISNIEIHTPYWAKHITNYIMVNKKNNYNQD